MWGGESVTGACVCVGGEGNWSMCVCVGESVTGACVCVGGETVTGAW